VDAADAADYARYHAALAGGTAGYLHSVALQQVWSTVARANEFVDRQAPWKLARTRPATRSSRRRSRRSCASSRGRRSRSRPTCRQGRGALGAARRAGSRRRAAVRRPRRARRHGVARPPRRAPLPKTDPPATPA
jgi:hypothetical protein